MMSHELRTPLAGMLGFSELLLMEKSLNDKQSEYANYIFSAGKRLLHILSDLLEISVIEAGKINIQFFDLNIQKVIQDVYVLLEDKFKKKNVDFEIDVQCKKEITSDPPRLRQILFNLVGNAIKFTEEGKVKVTVEKQKDKYLFSVKDTGIGINEKDQDIIFDMFRQVEASSIRKYGGTGLGLAICKKLIEALNGQIWLESTPGRGSTFYFSIPINQSARKQNLDEQRKKQASKKKDDQINILFAEDDEINFQFIENIIKSNDNYSGNGFYNGKDLLDEFLKNKDDYDIILLDIAMPIMDGVETLLEIRKNDKNIPVIAITAFGMKNDENKYLQLGFSDYISKPLTLEEFDEKIHVHIK
jgi:CheY-like chemotaxis protein